MKYTASDYLNHAYSLSTEASELFQVANKEYAKDNNFLENFSFVASAMEVAGIEGFTPKHAAMVYAMKSIFSILKGHSTRQSMRSRYLDVINYLTIASFYDEVVEGNDADA